MFSGTAPTRDRDTTGPQTAAPPPFVRRVKNWRASDFGHYVDQEGLRGRSTAAVLVVVLLAGTVLQGGSVAHAASADKCSPILANVPQVDIPDHPAWKTVYDYAWSNWERLILNNTKMFNPCWIDEGFGAGGATWQWDTLFGTLGARWAFSEFPAIETQENFYAAQGADGFIGQKLSEQRESFKASSVNPPIFAWIEWEYYLMSGDASHFTKVINGRTVFQHLVDYFYYFWQSTTYHRPDGSWAWSGIDSGRDCVSAATWVDLPAQMATAAYYLAKIAGVVGDPDTQTEMQGRHEELVTLLTNRHWNASQGFYENLNADGSFDTMQDSPQGLWTMIGRVATESQVAAMVGRLMDPGAFFRYHPVPSVSAASPYYYAGCKWYGPVWPPDVIETVKGLVAQGQTQPAFDIALQDVVKTVATYESNGGHVCENYQADRDGCYGGRDLTWSSAAYVVSLMDIVLGLAPDAPNNALAWTIGLVEPYTVSNLRFGSTVVTVSSARRAGPTDGARLTVTSDNALSLTVTVPDQDPCLLAIAANTTTTFDCGTFTGGTGPSPSPSPSVAPSPSPSPSIAPSPSASPSAPPPGDINLALNRPTTVSSYTNTSGSAAVDGSLTTYWRSRKRSSLLSEWLSVDLGAPTSIRQVVLQWNTKYYARAYTIQVSSDGSTWTTVSSTTTGDGGTDTIGFGPVAARFVRMDSTAWTNAVERCYLNELEIFQ